MMRHVVSAAMMSKQKGESDIVIQLICAYLLLSHKTYASMRTNVTSSSLLHGYNLTNISQPDFGWGCLHYLSG